MEQCLVKMNETLSNLKSSQRSRLGIQKRHGEGNASNLAVVEERHLLALLMHTCFYQKYHLHLEKVRSRLLKQRSTSVLIIYPIVT